MGVLVAIWLTLDISGAHLNMAMTLMFAFHNKFPFKNILPYVLA
jgi:glycerol uptake facilitator-like aquaporin